MSKFTILVTARSFGTSDAMASNLLKQNGCKVLHLKETPQQSLRTQLEQHIPEADAIIAGLETYDSELLSLAGKLKVISRYGVGYDAIDKDFAKKQNIKITITPGANSDSVADYAAALILSAARHVPFMDQTMKGGNSQRPAGVELWQKTLGIIGTGRIGSGVIKRLQGFQMKTLCYDVYENEDIKKDKMVSYTDLNTLIENSDFISIHTPLTGETENLFNRETFKRMKKCAVLVNTARGGIINEESLYEALREGEIGAAALDVTLETPYKGRLKELPNCILTPHAGAATVEASSKMSLMAAQNALTVLETGTCDFTV